LVLRSAGFFMRLRVQFRAVLPVFVGAVAAGFLLPTMLLLLLMLNHSPELFGFGLGELFAIAATANVGFFVALVLLATFVRSLVPSAAEHYLPRAVTFRVDGLRVEPQTGNAYEVSWTWISSAIKTARGIDLKIAISPPFTLHVTPAMVGEKHFEQMQIWLAQHRKF
jgi:hypothetical protein